LVLGAAFYRATAPDRKAFVARGTLTTMREEAEVREQYEFLAEQLADEEMRHEGVRQLFSHYKRALGWVLEEEHL
jgi:hypothetical protein